LTSNVTDNFGERLPAASRLARLDPPPQLVPLPRVYADIADILGHPTPPQCQ
jgi:hypothetical protein